MDKELPYELRDFPHKPVEVSSPTVGFISEQFGLDLPGSITLERAYRTVFERFAPFSTWMSARILQRLHVEIERDPSVLAAFMARDGHVFAAGARALDPVTFRDHCREIRLSRNSLEALWQDHVRRTGSELPLDEKTFRTFKDKVPPEASKAAVKRHRAYLRSCGLPVDQEGARVVLVDIGLSGSAAELLHQVFGWDTLSLLAAAVETDKHPRADRIEGLLVHVRPHDGLRVPVRYLPDDPSLTLVSNLAVNIVEELISGPQATVARIGRRGPVSGPWALYAQARPPREWANERALRAMRTAVLLAAHRHAEQWWGVPLDVVMRENEQGRDRFISDIRRLTVGDQSLDRTYMSVMRAASVRVTNPTEAQYKAMRGIAFTNPAARVSAHTTPERGIPDVTTRAIPSRNVSRLAGLLDAAPTTEPVGGPGAVCVRCPDAPAPIRITPRTKRMELSPHHALTRKLRHVSA